MSSDASIAHDTIDDPHDRELQVLEHIAEASVVRQRDIARIVGVSLGMANSILKRLARKGLITMRKINNRNVMYAVSPRGLDQIARRSYRYLRRTIKNVVAYRTTIESLIALVASQGFSQVTLIDDSDLDFIVEHACHEVGLGLRRVRGHDVAGSMNVAEPDDRRDPSGADGSHTATSASDEKANGSAFLLHSERYEPPAGRRRLDDIERTITGGACEAYLSELLI